MKKHARPLQTAALVCALAVAATAQTTVHVDADATGPVHDGSTWCQAYLELHEALTAAEADPNITTIRVAKGTYRPSSAGLSDPREATFELINGVAVAGGYAGCGAPNPDVRNIAVYETVLSGDRYGDDDPSIIITFLENAYHVVTASGADPSAVMDGVTVTAGTAESFAAPHHFGGGVFCLGGSPTLIDCTVTGNSGWYAGGMYFAEYSNPTLVRCTISDNVVIYEDGAGVHNRDSSPVLLDCVISANVAGGRGGGMSNFRSSPALTECVFSNNRSNGAGGGMFNNDHSSPTITNCRFLGNRATSSTKGGAVCNGGQSNPILRNCLFSGNRSAAGAGMHNEESAPVLIACIFTGNSGDVGPAICNDSSTLTVSSCIVWDNHGLWDLLNHDNSVTQASYSCIEGGWPGIGNIDADPIFVDPDGPDNDPNTWEDNDYRLAAGSPCIDAGDPNYVPAPGETDLDELLRVWDGDGDSVARVDMGAYEFAARAHGDVNCDGVIDTYDIDAFVLALGDPAAYAAANPGCDRQLADCDRDGKADTYDIDGFVALILAE